MFQIIHISLPLFIPPINRSQNAIRQRHVRFDKIQVAMHPKAMLAIKIEQATRMNTISPPQEHMSRWYLHNTR
jgi:hypothetical protein